MLQILRKHSPHGSLSALNFGQKLVRSLAAHQLLPGRKCNGTRRTLGLSGEALLTDPEKQQRMQETVQWQHWDGVLLSHVRKDIRRIHENLGFGDAMQELI